MKQGVLTNGRVRLLLAQGHSCYRPRRSGERRRKSVRGCIVDANLSVLSLVIVKKGEAEIPGLTDRTVPRRLGPKRASKIRRLFNLTKDDDVRQYVLRRPLAVKGEAKEGKKPKTKAPKIQRLITPLVLQRKRNRLAMKRKRVVKRREARASSFLRESFAVRRPQHERASKTRARSPIRGQESRAGPNRSEGSGSSQGSGSEGASTGEGSSSSGEGTSCSEGTSSSSEGTSSGSGEGSGTSEGSGTGEGSSTSSEGSGSGAGETSCGGETGPTAGGQTSAAEEAEVERLKGCVEGLRWSEDGQIVCWID